MTEKKLDWNKPIETTEGYPAKVISTDYKRAGITHRVVQIEFLHGDSGAHIYRDDGKTIYNTGQLRNKARKVTKWYNLYADRPGYRYFDTESEARTAMSGGMYRLATLSIEIEEPA
jgi:hypothetical protein